MIQHTSHSEYRSAQRGLTNEEIEYVSIYASHYHCGGALIYFLIEQDLPEDDRRRDWAVHLVGTALVCSKDGGTLLTVWRNRRNGLKLIRKKPSYSFHNSERWQNI